MGDGSWEMDHWKWPGRGGSAPGLSRGCFERVRGRRSGEQLLEERLVVRADVHPVLLALFKAEEDARRLLPHEAVGLVSTLVERSGQPGGALRKDPAFES